MVGTNLWIQENFNIWDYILCIPLLKLFSLCVFPVDLLCIPFVYISTKIWDPVTYKNIFLFLTKRVSHIQEFEIMYEIHVTKENFQLNFNYKIWFQINKFRSRLIILKICILRRIYVVKEFQSRPLKSIFFFFKIFELFQ